MEATTFAGLPFFRTAARSTGRGCAATDGGNSSGHRGTAGEARASGL